MKVYLLAKRTTANGLPITVYHIQRGTWTDDPTKAAATTVRDLVEHDAETWNDYWTVKGYDTRAFVATFTIAELEAMETESE